LMFGCLNSSSSSITFKSLLINYWSSFYSSLSMSYIENIFFKLSFFCNELGLIKSCMNMLSENSPSIFSCLNYSFCLILASFILLNLSLAIAIISSAISGYS
jgi:hypothetical protein